MATGGGDQVWTWKKRKTVAASRAARGGNEITTLSVVICPPVNSTLADSLAGVRQRFHEQPRVGNMVKST